MKDFRITRGAATVDPTLISQGEKQLLNEIALLEHWLQTLDSSPSDDAEKLKTRRIYQDMLRSRQDMLLALRRQTQS